MHQRSDPRAMQSNFRPVEANGVLKLKDLVMLTEELFRSRPDHANESWAYGSIS
jgi:hypothetical protein